MSANQKIARLLLLYILTAALLLPNSGFFDRDVAGTPELLSRIPANIGPWHGKDLDDRRAREFFLVGEDTIFQPMVRTFRRQGNDREIVLNALEDLKGFQRGIHDPRFCYESLGWTIQSFENILIENRQAGSLLKLLTYTDAAGASRRMEIYGYLADQKVFTSDIALRLTHFANRVKKMFQRPRGHVLYVGISAELEPGREKELLEDLKFLAAEILAALTSTDK